MHFDKDKLYVFSVEVNGDSAVIDLPEIYAISDGAPVQGYRVEDLVDKLSDANTVRFRCDGYYFFSQAEKLHKLISELRKVRERTFELDVASPLDEVIEAAQESALRVILLACFDTVMSEFGKHSHTRKQVHIRSAELGHDYVFIASI